MGRWSSDIGADDYVSEPFSPRELVLRIKKLLQRSVAAAEKPETILGTVAGADTLLVICRDEAAAQVVEEEINRFLQE